ncbi:helix-turn-helix domain-containing protein [Amycolatopsis sp. NPDC021455]|uniref:TetR/AcrR family transcriptional regulator n=1 Tax=Amycolatopsis sp. NPDC021455 TaxID=3154901 RepID=UPI0033C18164
MRSDAQANRDLVIRAARRVFSAQGAGAPIDEVARQAGVGAATIYRHFADKRALIEYVCLDALKTTARMAREVAEAEADPAVALESYLDRVLDWGAGSTLSAVLGELSLTEELAAAHREHDEAVGALLTAAQRAGAVRPELSTGDVSHLLACLARIPGEAARLRPRYLRLVVDGMRPAPDGARLPGPAPSHEDMEQLLFKAP